MAKIHFKLLVFILVAIAGFCSFLATYTGMIFTGGSKKPIKKMIPLLPIIDFVGSC